MSDHDFPKIITVEEGDVFELVNRVANPCVEQALEIIHLLPVEDPIRLDLLRVCGKQLMGQLTYVAVITGKDKS